MGLFDLPAPAFAAIDGILAGFIPDFLRLVLWGILAGWLTMIVYRRLSNQERISILKGEQKQQQKVISNFDGEFDELLPLIRNTLGLGFKQLGLSLGPALLATIPVLFLIAWVAGQFGYNLPDTGTAVQISAEPGESSLQFSADANVKTAEQGWIIPWPEVSSPVAISLDNRQLLELPLSNAVPVIHKKQWWNVLFANPLGYLSEDLPVEVVTIDLPAQQFVPAGPGWVQGWMFLFFMVFLISSIAFKFLLKID